MPRANDGQSERFHDAVDSVSALGNPEDPFKNDTKHAWGDVDDDYYQEKQTDVRCSTFEETIEFYDHKRSEDIQIIDRDDRDQK